jgi:MFS family permease
MVVQGTFLPDIINSVDGLAGYGGYTWLVVGIAGIRSSIVWMRLAHKFGSINIMMLAMLLQVIGVLIPAFSNNVYLNLASGVLFGGTFVGLVALFMNYGGQLAAKNPVLIMGAITSAYSVGQILAPLYCIAFIEKFNSYNPALYLTALIVFCGVLLLGFAKYKYKHLQPTSN